MRKVVEDVIHRGFISELTSISGRAFYTLADMIEEFICVKIGEGYTFKETSSFAITFSDDDRKYYSTVTMIKYKDQGIQL